MLYLPRAVRVFRAIKLYRSFDDTKRKSFWKNADQVGRLLYRCSSTEPYLITHVARETCVNRPRLVVVLSLPDPSSHDFYTILYGAKLRNAISYCTCESLLMLYLLWHNINVMCAHGSRYTCVCIIGLIYVCIYINCKRVRAHGVLQQVVAVMHTVNWNVFARRIQFIYFSHFPHCI